MRSYPVNNKKQDEAHLSVGQMLPHPHVQKPKTYAPLLLPTYTPLNLPKSATAGELRCLLLADFVADACPRALLRV
jgi:hypothetical protein